MVEVLLDIVGNDRLQILKIERQMLITTTCK